MLLLTAFLLAYAGFAALCASMRRHQRQIFAAPPKPSTVTLLRVVGYGVIFLGLIPCYLEWGWAMGTVAWVCLLPIAAMMLVWPFTYAAKPSVMAGGVAAVLACILFVASIAMRGHLA